MWASLVQLNCCILHNNFECKWPINVTIYFSKNNEKRFWNFSKCIMYVLCIILNFWTFLNYSLRETTFYWSKPQLKTQISIYKYHLSFTSLSRFFFVHQHLNNNTKWFCNIIKPYRYMSLHLLHKTQGSCFFCSFFDRFETVSILGSATNMNHVVPTSIMKTFV